MLLLPSAVLLPVLLLGLPMAVLIHIQKQKVKQGAKEMIQTMEEEVVSV